VEAITRKCGISIAHFEIVFENERDGRGAAPVLSKLLTRAGGFRLDPNLGELRIGVPPRGDCILRQLFQSGASIVCTAPAVTSSVQAKIIGDHANSRDRNDRISAVSADRFH
jgi:hypothetical protein